MSEVFALSLSPGNAIVSWWQSVRFDSMLILAILGANVVVAELLCRKTPLRHFGTAMTVLVLAAICANVGLIPTKPPEWIGFSHQVAAGGPIVASEAIATAKTSVAVYRGIMGFAIDLCIFWILLTINIRDVLKAGSSMIFLFFAGAVGVCAGVLLGMWAVDGSSSTAFGDLYQGVGGTFVATYVGGGQNFAALATHYKLEEHPGLFAGMVAVDNFFTLVWMVATFLIPRAVLKLSGRTADLAESRELITGIDEDTERVHPLDLGVLMATGCAAAWISPLLSAQAAEWGVEIPAVLILTTIGLAIAQVPGIRRYFSGAQLLGMFILYLFLAVIGAQCDAAAVREIGSLAWTIIAFVAIVVFTHGAVIFGTAWLCRMDTEAAAVASQANIGGVTTALALARGLGRADLTLPGILVGTLGYGVGNYFAFFVARSLL
ncbi:MAG: DUF819 family protein [Planctomycetaceae bacterium]